MKYLIALKLAAQRGIFGKERPVMSQILFKDIIMQ